MAQNRYESRQRAPRASDRVLGVRPVFLAATALAVVVVAWIVLTFVLSSPPTVVR